MLSVRELREDDIHSLFATPAQLGLMDVGLAKIPDAPAWNSMFTAQLAQPYAPYALNPAPNKTLGRAGFSFSRHYIGTPGSINFEQEVNVWEMSRDAFIRLQETKAPR